MLRASWCRPDSSNRWILMTLGVGGHYSSQALAAKCDSVVPNGKRPTR